MARLNSSHKRLIVMRLAAFVTVTEIIAELKDEGVEASIQQVRHYHPNTVGTEVADEWRELFEELREAFLADTADVAISHKAYRLRQLDWMYRKAEKSKNLVLCCALLEQAAKETGGMYTNRREITGAKGKPLIPDPFDDLTTEQLVERAQELLATMGK